MRRENAYAFRARAASCPHLSLLFPPATARAPSIALSLPPELWLAILAHLFPSEAWRTRLVCKVLLHVVEDHLSVRWFADCRFTPFEWRNNNAGQYVGQSWLDKGLDWSRYWDGSVECAEIVRRGEQYLEVRLPVRTKTLTDQLRSAKKRSNLWYDILGNQRRAAMLEIERIPLWVRLLENDTLSLAIMFANKRLQRAWTDPWFDLYAAGARRVRAGRAREGFRVGYDGDGPALLIDWRVLLSTMFNYPRWNNGNMRWRCTSTGGLYMSYEQDQ